MENVVTTTGAQIREDHDYDAPQFNLPRIIRGSANIVICGEISTDGAASGSFTMKIQKWDGTTATLLATGTSSKIGDDTDLGQGQHILNVPITIPITPFKVGEQLRVTVRPEFDRNGGTTMSAIYGVSPNNLSGSFFDPATDTNPPSITKLIPAIPFQID
ncbi:MAG TPA: hypothetical protein ENI13_00590 [candidate division CPR3 bacterium]|uniref:Uncharacterized protein n=1 Tax=candidate division CPR3 bacterium TaxID=2268181 RepID=A0A7C1T5J4_UNCC3|nr:hypothetical protein [candidate division CPR3 bacterium]